MKKKIKFKVLDVQPLIEDNNVVKLILFLFTKEYGDMEVKVPYSKELKEALDQADELTGTVVDKNTFTITSIKGYNPSSNKDPISCPFCGKKLLEVPYLHDDNCCFNVSCQNESIINIMDIMNRIDTGISVDEAAYVLRMYNTRLNPKVDILSIYDNLVRREPYDDVATKLKNRIEYFIYSCDTPSFLKMLNIDITKVILHHTVIDMELEEFLDFFPFTNDTFVGDEQIARFINSVIRINKEYINRFLKYRIDIFSNYL